MTKKHVFEFDEQDLNALIDVSIRALELAIEAAEKCGAKPMTIHHLGDARQRVSMAREVQKNG